MAFTKEDDHYFLAAQIVSKLVRREFGGDLDDLPAIDEDLARDVIRTAQRNKLLKPVLKELDRLGIKVPADLQPDVDIYLRKTMKRTAAALATLREASHKLSEAGVTHAAFKGPVRQIALAQDLFERPVADIDILVPSQDFARATTLLRELGFFVPNMSDSPWWRYFLGEHPLFPTKHGRCQIDLHHHVQHPSCPRPRDEKAAMFDQLEWLDVSGQKVPRLGADAIFLHTVISVIKGLMNREPTGSHVLDLGRQIHSATDERRAEFERIASNQRLAKSYAVARRAVMVVTGVKAGPTPRWFVSDGRLQAMLLTPEAWNLRWPPRRTLLWNLVDGRSITKTANFARECVWWAAAEATRRTHDVSLASDPKDERATILAYQMK